MFEKLKKIFTKNKPALQITVTINGEEAQLTNDELSELLKSLGNKFKEIKKD